MFMITTVLAAIAGGLAAAAGHATQTAIKKCIDSNESKIVTDKISTEEDTQNILYKELDECIQLDDVSYESYEENRTKGEEYILRCDGFCRRCASWLECDNKPRSFLCNKLIARGNCYRCCIYSGAIRPCYIGNCTKNSWGSQECIKARRKTRSLAEACPEVLLKTRSLF